MTNNIATRLFSLILILGLQISAFGQCSIENFTVTIIDCVNDNNAGLVVNFESNTPSNVGYQVSTELGFEVIQYNQLPYTLIVSGNCITDYNLTVTDLSVADCAQTQEIGIICCDVMCSVEMDIIELLCIEDEAILANIEFNVTGTLDDSLDIYTNGDYLYSTSVSDTSMILSQKGTVQNLVVCSQGTECCDTIDIISPCYCNILDITAAVTSCDSEMESYFLRLDFDVIVPSSDSFNVGRPGNALGTHAYEDLPVLIGPISFDDNDDDIFVLDQVDAFCFNFIPHITLDSCEAVTCQLSDLEITSTVDCDNNEETTFNIKFNTSLESEGFQILIDGTTYGPFQYGQNSYNVGPLPSNGNISSTVEIIDLGDSSCTIEGTVDHILCDCDFENVMTTQFCNDDLLVAVQINFNASGAVSDSFDVTSIINTQRYAYSDLPITINGLPSEDIALEISDKQNSSCSLTIAEALECVLVCSITNFEVALDSCASIGLANLSFTFDYDDLTTDSVALSYNGSLIRNYFIEENEEYSIPLLEVDCELDFNSFSLAPINDPDCAAEFSMPNIDCCTPCEITNLNPVLTCDDFLGPYVQYNFEYSGDSLDIYELYINDQYLEDFNYNAGGVTGPIVVVSVTNGEDLPVDLIYEIEFPLCTIQDTFTAFCTEQCIENIELDTLTCTEGMFTASLNFDHAETNDSFQLFVNDIVENTYSFDQLPLEIGPYIGNGITDYTFTLSLNNFNNCTGTFEFGTLDCGPNSIDDYILNNIKWSTLNDGVRLEGISSFENISLIDLNGRLLQTKNIYSDQIMIPSDNYSTGLYFVRLQDEKGNIHSIKIVL